MVKKSIYITFFIKRGLEKRKNVVGEKLYIQAK